MLILYVNCIKNSPALIKQRSFISWRSNGAFRLKRPLCYSLQQVPELKRKSTSVNSLFVKAANGEGKIDTHFIWTETNLDSSNRVGETHDGKEQRLNHCLFVSVPLYSCVAILIFIIVIHMKRQGMFHLAGMMKACWMLAVGSWDSSADRDLWILFTWRE